MSGLSPNWLKGKFPDNLHSWWGLKLKTPGGIFENVPNQRNQDLLITFS